MTLGERLRKIRTDIGLSQEAVGAMGFVSTPGWIKLENGQRQASEKLINNLIDWLVSDKHIKSNRAKHVKEELLILKYLGNRSSFVREMAKARAQTLPDNGVALLAIASSIPKRRGRPPTRMPVAA